MTIQARVTLTGVCVLLLGASVLVPAQEPPLSASVTLSIANGRCGKTLLGNDGGDRIRGNAEPTTYSDTTVINGVAYDPDIIIEQ